MTEPTSLKNEPSDALRDVLVDVGLILVAYELIRALVVRPVESFYHHVTFGEGMPFRDFATDVSSRSKHRFDACLLWLRDHMQAVTAEQYDSIHAVRELRDQLAHGIHKNLLNHDFARTAQVLTEAKESLFALDNFWVRMDIQADPEFVHIDDWSAVYSDSFALLDDLLRKLRHLE